MSWPLTNRVPLWIVAPVENVPFPASVHAFPCIKSVWKFRNFPMSSAPVPSSTRLLIPPPPWTLPLRTEPVSRMRVLVALLAKLMASAAPLIVPLLVTVDASPR